MQLIKRIPISTLKIDLDNRKICLTDSKGIPIISMTGIHFSNVITKFTRISINTNEVTVHNDSVLSTDNKSEDMIINIIDMINHKLYYDDKIISKEAFLERLFCHIEKFAKEY